MLGNAMQTLQTKKKPEEEESGNTLLFFRLNIFT